MQTERFVVAGCTWALILAGLWSCRRQSPLHLIVPALLVTGLVGSFFPLMSLFVEPSSWRNISGIPPDVVLATQIDYLAYAAGLLIACLLAALLGWLRSPKSADRSEETAWLRHRDLAVSAGMVLLGAALYGTYVLQVGLEPLTNRVDYAQKYLISAGLGPLTFGLPMMIAGCLWAEGSEMPRRRKNPFLLVGLGITVWSIGFISVRTNLVILLMGYAYILCRRRRMSLRSVRPALIVVILAGYLGLESYSLFRGAHRGDVRDAVQVLQEQSELALARIVGGSELSHPFLTTAEVRMSARPGELAGASYAAGLVALVPRSLYPDRPRTLSERFVWDHYAWVAAIGGGTGFSMVAEAWLNFGAIVGPFCVATMLGMVLLWIERRCVLRQDGALARLAPYVVFFVAMQHRNEFATLFKQVSLLLMAVTTLWVVADAIWWVRLTQRHDFASSHGLRRADPMPHAHELQRRS